MMLSCVAAVLLSVPVAAPVPKEVIQREKAAREFRANIAKLAATYGAMAPEAVATSLKQLVGCGKIDYAAEILILMKERSAARALEALDDPGLALALIERMIATRARERAPSVRPKP